LLRGRVVVVRTAKRAERRCGRCGEVGHNFPTFKVGIEDADDSAESEV
jgi:hypothetical protein